MAWAVLAESSAWLPGWVRGGLLAGCWPPGRWCSGRSAGGIPAGSGLWRCWLSSTPGRAGPGILPGIPWASRRAGRRRTCIVTSRLYPASRHGEGPVLNGGWPRPRLPHLILTCGNVFMADFLRHAPRLCADMEGRGMAVIAMCAADDSHSRTPSEWPGRSQSRPYGDARGCSSATCLRSLRGGGAEVPSPARPARATGRRLPALARAA